MVSSAAGYDVRPAVNAFSRPLRCSIGARNGLRTLNATSLCRLSFRRYAGSVTRRAKSKWHRREAILAYLKERPGPKYWFIRREQDTLKAVVDPLQWRFARQISRSSEHRNRLNNSRAVGVERPRSVRVVRPIDYPEAIP